MVVDPHPGPSKVDAMATVGDGTADKTLAPRKK